MQKDGFCMSTFGCSFGASGVLFGPPGDPHEAPGDPQGTPRGAQGIPRGGAKGSKNHPQDLPKPPFLKQGPFLLPFWPLFGPKGCSK